MIVFPNAKINLGLNVIARRADDYHNLETCFYPIPWRDALEVIEAPEFRFTSSGLPIPGDPSGNLCLKAYHALKQHHPLPPVHIHLHKVIPMGAGLGGGSADGAFMIKVLNDKFELGLSDEELEHFAGQLGSDCPFFIRNNPVFAEGRGTDFSPISVNLSGRFICLIKPDIHISTQEAYAGVTPTKPEKSLKELLALPIDQWKDRVINDFEKSIFANHPELQTIKANFYTLGAEYAAMSGSGSCMFGIFKEKTAIENSVWFDL